MRRPDFSVFDDRSATLFGRSAHALFNNLQAVENRRLFSGEKPPVFGGFGSLPFCQF
jgi:hypothetical protein